MDKFCVIGNPIEHSLSPKIFKYIFEKLNFNALYDIKALSNENDFVDFMKIQKKENNYSGMNITLPYKELAYQVVDSIHHTCKDINSINCVKIINNQLIGYNTDQYGLLMLIKKNKINLENKNIIVLGNGGIARTSIKTLLDNFKNTIYVLGRDSGKINKLIDSFNQHLYKDRIQRHKEILSTKYIVFNCLSLNIDETSINNMLSYIPISNIELMVDLNYLETVFNKKLIENNCRVIMGMDMLLYQALESLDIWFDDSCSHKIAYDKLKEHIIN